MTCSRFQLNVIREEAQYAVPVQGGRKMDGLVDGLDAIENRHTMVKGVSSAHPQGVRDLGLSGISPVYLCFTHGTIL